VPEKDSLWNKWGVGAQGDWIVILGPPRRLSKDDALTFAAWIVALTGAGDEFQKRLDEICSL
jgi:hypothetical protein